MTNNGPAVHVLLADLERKIDWLAHNEGLDIPKTGVNASLEARLDTLQKTFIELAKARMPKQPK